MSEVRLIDANALKERNTVIGIVNGQKMKVIPVEAIDNAPTIEPTFGLFKDMLCSECEKKPKGEWRCICDTKYWQFTYEHYECTKCHYKGECKFKYCPNCGAEMQNM